MTKITRQEYMSNSSELHHAYFLQFATQASYHFINTRIGLPKLLTSTDEHLNDLYKISRGGAGGWIWDETPINLPLAREMREGNSMSTPTCVGKAVARELLKEHKQRNEVKA
jgi:hypothetical protein